VKKIRLALETAVVRLTVWLLPRLPRPLILAVSNAVGGAAYALDWRGRNTALENLRAAFGKDGITPAQARRIACASYQTFTRTFLDLFWSAKLNKENFRDFIEIRIEDPSVEEDARQHGAIWVTPHFGNFELVSYVWGFRGFPFVIVTQDFKNPALTSIFKKLREGSGHTIISQEGAMLRLMKTLSRHGHAALLTDLNIKPGKMAAALRCFGMLTCATTLHASLSQRTGVPIISGVCLPLPDGGYRVSVHRALHPKDFSSPAAMSQAVWDLFEKHIRETPEAWMWMYKHWRYLPTPDAAPDYPAYANYWKVFRQLVEETAVQEEAKKD
jgi:Kdo2-lipid IVA lauroyltransferase/acyltransferase